MHVPEAVSVLLVLALFLDVGWLLRGQLKASDSRSQLATESAAEQISPDPLSNSPALVAAHLFGQTEATADAPQSAAPLVLVGVIATRTPAGGMAIIGSSPSAVRLYAVGDVIASARRLAAVYADRVVLDAGGALETLPLSTKRAVVAFGTSTVLPPALTDPVPLDTTTLASGFVRVLPVYQHDRFIGLKMAAVGSRGAGALDGIGLRSGDLITNVQGEALADDVSRASQALGLLAGSGRVTVTVNRNGHEKQLDLNLPGS